MKRIAVLVLLSLLLNVFAACSVGSIGNDLVGEESRSEHGAQSDERASATEKEDDEPKIEAKVAMGYDYYAIITKDGALYMFGDNEFAQTGNRGKSSSRPTRIGGSEIFVDVKTAGYMTAALTASGDLWTVGYNEFGQLGNGTNTVYTPKKVLSKVKSFVVSYDGMAAVTENGDLYAWGAHFETTPKVILSDVAYVTASEYGSANVAAVTKAGELYYFGLDDQRDAFEQYVDSSQKIDFIYPVKILDNVEKVVLGHHYGAIAAITKTGELYAAGFYKKENSGMVKLMDNAKDVVIGMGESKYSYLLALDGNDTLYVYGYMFNRRVGTDSVYGGTGIYPEDLTKVIKVMDDVKSMWAADANAFVITKDDALYAWGKNESGDCGTGNDLVVETPVKIMDGVACVTASRVVTSGADLTHNNVAVITLDGTLYTWGNNNGMLGYDPGESAGYFVSLPTKLLENIKEIKFGTPDSKCAAAITNDGEIYIWGKYKSEVYYESTDYQILPIIPKLS
ncbi:MAG: hypothetical protein IJZ33_05800 [Clostridia bacterium]|nr:hypothetical protein [Clostridia bacterium]